MNEELTKPERTSVKARKLVTVLLWVLSGTAVICALATFPVYRFLEAQHGKQTRGCIANMRNIDSAMCQGMIEEPAIASMWSNSAMIQVGAHFKYLKQQFESQSLAQGNFILKSGRPAESDCPPPPVVAENWLKPGWEIPSVEPQFHASKPIRISLVKRSRKNSLLTICCSDWRRLSPRCFNLSCRMPNPTFAIPSSSGNIQK